MVSHKMWKWEGSLTVITCWAGCSATCYCFFSSCYVHFTQFEFSLRLPSGSECLALSANCHKPSNHLKNRPKKCIHFFSHNAALSLCSKCRPQKEVFPKSDECLLLICASSVLTCLFHGEIVPCSVASNFLWERALARLGRQNLRRNCARKSGPW